MRALEVFGFPAASLDEALEDAGGEEVATTGRYCEDF
jgi:hypothetical protein